MLLNPAVQKPLVGVAIGQLKTQQLSGSTEPMMTRSTRLFTLYGTVLFLWDFFPWVEHKEI